MGGWPHGKNRVLLVRLRRLRRSVNEMAPVHAGGHWTLAMPPLLCLPAGPTEQGRGWGCGTHVLTFNDRTDVPYVLIADGRQFLHHLDLPRKLLQEVARHKWGFARENNLLMKQTKPPCQSRPLSSAEVSRPSPVLPHTAFTLNTPARCSVPV